MEYERLMARLARIPHDRFVLHGGPCRPRHGYLVPCHPRVGFRKRLELDKKRVYATTVIAVAMLYAVIDAPSAAWDWQFLRVGGEYHLYCRIRGEFSLRNGYIHVLPRKQFADLRTWLICAARERVRPVQTLRVPAGIVPWMVFEKTLKLVTEYPEADRIEPGPRRVLRRKY